MTRWLVVHPSDELYGADRILLASIPLLGPQVSVWLPDDVEYPDRRLTRELEAMGVPVTRRPLPVARRARLTPSQAPVLAREVAAASAALLRERPDRVLLSTSATLPLAPSARIAGAAVMLHLHEIWGPTDRRLLSGPGLAVDRVIAVSDAARTALPERLRRRTRVIRNGVPDPGPPDAASRDALRASIGCPPGTLLVLSASRWNAWKGHDVLLRAWSTLRRDDIHLVVLGDAPPSGAAIDVPRLVADLPADAPPVTVVGPVADTAGWLAAADVVVVPSRQPDPLPTIALESLAHGRGVIGSRVGGLPEIVTDGCGRLVAAGDAAELAAALNAMTGASLAAWGAEGRTRWDDHFRVTRFRDELAAEFSSGLSGG